MSSKKNRNYIFEYYEKIKDGKVVVGKYIRAIYEHLLNGLIKKEYFLDLKKGNEAIVFMENFVHHHEGSLAPNKLKLELWQKAMIQCIFGIVRKDGTRQFTEVMCVVGRKNGKTLLASGIAQKCMFVDGEYGGRIYFAAPKLEQASLCFTALQQSIQHEPILDRMTQKRRTDLYVESTNTTAKALAFNSKKSDGLNISLAVCDEIASWSGDGGLKFYEVIKSSQGARTQPLLFSMTTAGYLNDGIYDELITRATRVINGESKEKRFLPFLYMIDDPTKWNDINELKKSNPNLNVSISKQYLLDEIAIAEGSLSKKAEFLTKYCNIKQNSSVAWLSTETIKKAIGTELTMDQFRNCYCVGGIDLSRTTDLTSACIVIEKDGILNVISKFWLPREKIEEAIAKDGVPYDIYIKKGFLEPSGDNFVDYNDCFNWFKTMVEEYKLYPLKVGYDRYSAQYLVQDMQSYGFNMDDVYQGNNLTPVIKEFEGLIKDGKLNIGNNDLLKIHLLNTALKVETETEKVRIIKMNQTAHIDGMASLLDALCVRQKWFGEIGHQLVNE